MPNDPQRMTLLDIYQRLLMIEEYIKEGKLIRSQINDTMTKLDLRCHNLELMVHGESTNSDKRIRDGINRRVESLEAKDSEVAKIKGNFLKVAVGSLAMAVGSFILWIFQLIWKATGKG